VYLIVCPLFPNYFVTLKEVGLPMINSVILGFDKKVLEAKDIAALAKKTPM
jgi:hypothetical protein